MGACFEKPLDALICIRIDELWLDTIQHARALVAGGLGYPIIKVMAGRKQINPAHSAPTGGTRGESTSVCGASFIFTDPAWRLPVMPTPEKPFKFEFLNSPNYTAEIRDVDAEGIRHVEVLCTAEANKKVGVLILSIAKQIAADAFPPPPRPAVGGFLRRDHWTNFNVKVGAGQAFSFVQPRPGGSDAKDGLVTYTAFASLTSGGGEQGDYSAAPRWQTPCEPGAESVPNWGNKSHTFARMRATPRALEIHVEATRAGGKDRNRGLCRIDLKDPLGWVKAGPVLFPVLPYTAYAHPNSRVDQSFSQPLRRPGRVCLVDMPEDDHRTDFSVERSGFAPIHELSDKLMAFVDIAAWEERRKQMDPAQRAESIMKENNFIASVEAFFIEIGPDTPGGATAAGTGAPVIKGSSSGGGKDDLEGVELQDGGAAMDKGTPNRWIDLARRIRSHPKFTRIPIFALIQPGRQLNIGSDNPFTIPPLKKPLKDEDVQFVLNRFCFNMGLLTVTLQLDYIAMTEDEKKTEAQRNPNSFDIDVGTNKRASMDRRAEETQREINEANARLADEAARQKIADEARAKREAEEKAKKDEADADAAAKEKEELAQKAAAYKEKLMKQKGGDGSAPEDTTSSGIASANADGVKEEDKVVELIDTKEAMARAWKKKAALALYKLNHVEKANEHAAATSATSAGAQMKSAEPIKLDVEVKSVELNYSVPPSSKLVYVVSVGNSIKDSAPLLVGTEGLLPHESAEFRGGALSMEVKFKEKKAPKPGMPPNANKSKKKQPTILTISVFAYPADEEQYSAADLVGQFVCGESGSSGLNPPDVLAVTAFWRSIEGKPDTKRVALYTIGKNGAAKHTGTVEFTALLHVKKDPNAVEEPTTASAAAPASGTAAAGSSSSSSAASGGRSAIASAPLANADVAGSLMLSEENKARIVQDKADEERRRLAEAARLVVFAAGESMIKHSFTADPSPVWVYYKPADKSNPCGSIYWADHDVKESDREHPSRRMGIHRIQELLHGKFKGPLALPDDPLRCFAIVSVDGTINLEANSADQANDWLSTLERILSQNNFVSSKA